jgi:hypothetical protein
MWVAINNLMIILLFHVTIQQSYEKNIIAIFVDKKNEMKGN